jgi:hypothetical protein
MGKTPMQTRQDLDAIAERLKAHIVAIGLDSDYYVKVTWATESTSVYLTFSGHKIRVGDHGSAYRCSISVSPDEMTEADAIGWLNSLRTEQLEDEAE